MMMQESAAGLPNTDWSMIHALHGEEDQRAAALETLGRRYWPAIYAYIRRTGRDSHEAADLTQGFMTTVVLERRLAESARQEHGRFRNFLLTSLQNYLRDQHRHDTRQRRADAGGSKPLPLSEVDEINLADARRHATPEAAFEYHFSAALVRGVLRMVQASCLAEGLEAHWTVFERRVMRPLLTGEAAPSLTVLAAQLGLNDEAQVSNLAITVKRRFARLLRDEIRATVAEENEVEDELHLLFKALERSA